MVRPRRPAGCVGAPGGHLNLEPFDAPRKMSPGQHTDVSQDSPQGLELQHGHSPELEDRSRNPGTITTVVPLDYQLFYSGSNNNNSNTSSDHLQPRCGPSNTGIDSGAHLQGHHQGAASSGSGLGHDHFPAQQNPAPLTDVQMDFGAKVGLGGGGDGGMGVSEMARMGIFDLHNLDALEARRAREEEIHVRDLQRTTRQTENLLFEWDLGPIAADANPNPSPSPSPTTSFPNDSVFAAPPHHHHVPRPIQLLQDFPNQTATLHPPPKDLSFDTPDTPNRLAPGGDYAQAQTANSGSAGSMLESNQPFDRNFTLPDANPNQTPDQASHPFSQFGIPYALSSVWSDADSSFQPSTSYIDSSTSDFMAALRHPGSDPGPGAGPGPCGIVCPTPPGSVNKSPVDNNVANIVGYSSSSSLGFGSRVRTGGRAFQGGIGQWGAGDSVGMTGGGTGRDTRLMNPEDWNRQRQQDQQNRSNDNLAVPRVDLGYNPRQTEPIQLQNRQPYTDIALLDRYEQPQADPILPARQEPYQTFDTNVSKSVGSDAFFSVVPPTGRSNIPPSFTSTPAAFANQVDLSKLKHPPHHPPDNSDVTPMTIPAQFLSADPGPAPSSTPKLATSTSKFNEARTGGPKRKLKEVMAKCVICGLEFAKLLLRGTKKELSAPVNMAFLCKGCADVANNANTIDLAGGTTGDHREGRCGSGHIDVDKPLWDPLKDGIPPPCRDKLWISDRSLISTTSATHSAGTSSLSISKVLPHRNVDASKHKPLEDPNRSVMLQDSELADESVQKKLLAPTRLRQGGGILRKRSRKAEDDGGPATCDVCLRDLGVGGFTSIDDKTPIKFAIEVICVRCDERYKRCSDCGGGGGVRLGVGKWRAKELFVEGRKTCSLNHTRLAALSDMEYIVWRIKDISEDQKDGIVKLLSGFFRHTFLAGLAVPEVMETGVGMASNFQDVDNMSRDGWGFIEPTLRKDIEPTRQIRRYLGLRWCKPHPRKSSNPRKSAGAALAAKDEGCSRHNTGTGSLDVGEDKGHDGDGWGCGSINRPGKDLGGFIIAEWDVPNGSYFIQLNVPWATGDAFEGYTRLIWSMLKKANEDREREIERVDREGTEEEKRRGIPLIRHCWTMLFFSRESRVMNYLERRRKFMPIEEYMRKYPDTDRDMFPPKREVYIPREYTAGWQVLIRRQEEVSVADWEKKVELHDKKVREKPLKAKEVKALEEKQNIAADEGMGMIRGGDGDSSSGQLPEGKDRGEEEDVEDGLMSKMKRRREDGCGREGMTGGAGGSR